jgi:arylsulfatase A-like enzyme
MARPLPPPPVPFGQSRAERGSRSRSLGWRLALLGASVAVASGLARPPNLVLIFADDLGWRDVGYQGSDYHETPNIDHLATGGMVFTAAYAGAGNCAPSRACLLSGQYTPRHEVYAVGSTDRGPRNLMRLVPIPNRRSLAPENTTMAAALKQAGYVTAIFGKWHLEDGKGTLPENHGFDVVFESRHSWPGPAGSSDDPKAITSLTRRAVEFMAENRDRPFFAYLSHYAVHTPHQARGATWERSKAKPPGKQHNNALYAACLYDLDESVGLLLRSLTELGLERDTLVVFTSDNGGNVSQEPLRGKKGCYYEGGIREPFIARWPGVIRPGTRCDTPVINQDIYPTFLAVAGASAPAGKVLDGESLLPLFRQSGGLQRQAIFWHFPGYLDGPVPRGRDPVFRTRPVSVMRKGDWKIHLYHEEWVLDGGRVALAKNRAVELYNLKTDPGENKDLAGSQPGIRDELLDELLAWLHATHARLPETRNPAYAPEAPRPPPAKRA